ncbi:MAG TPA: GyrI-like domain-containing protein [Propionibacteriaceae bacterium]
MPFEPHFSIERKADWDWTMMIRQPREVDEDLFEQGLAEATRKKELPAANLMRLESFSEGLVAQILHIGPYAAEGPTIERLHAFIFEQGYERAGKHHEIYLGDPRRTAPEKLKTVLRQPIAARR